MKGKGELHELIDVLSEHECDRLAALIEETAGGDRYWETDIAIVYNEYVKGRWRHMNPGPPEAFAEQPAGTLPSSTPSSDSGGDGSGPDEGIFAPIPIVKVIQSIGRIELPTPRTVEAPLGKALLGRRTKRDFAPEGMTLEQLSTVLQLACGVNGKVAAYGYTHLPLRTFPSSGGLQAPEVYLSIQRVDGVASGLYHYHPQQHALDLLREGEYGQRLRELSLGQPWLETAAVVVAISGYYERLRWKYGERAYRFMCVDAGFLAQNLHLVAEGLGLGACAIAGFADDAVERLYQIDGRDEMVLLLVCLGVPR